MHRGGPPPTPHRGGAKVMGHVRLPQSTLQPRCRCALQAEHTHPSRLPRLHQLLWAQVCSRALPVAHMGTGDQLALEPSHTPGVLGAAGAGSRPHLVHRCPSHPALCDSPSPSRTCAHLRPFCNDFVPRPAFVGSMCCDPCQVRSSEGQCPCLHN